MLTNRVEKTDPLDARLPAGRCSQRELLIIRSKAAEAGMSVSEYMRHVCVHSTVIVREPLINVEFMTHIKRIGVNLNQYVRALHARGRESPERIDDALDQLENLLGFVFDGSKDR